MAEENQKNIKNESGLSRELSFWGAYAIGLGAMIGAGIFVLSGPAAEQAGPAASLSYIIAGLICLPVALSLSELATAMPQAGGSYHFVSRTIGPLPATIVGPANWLGLSFATGFYLVGLAEYLNAFVEIPKSLVIIAAGLFLIFINYIGAKQTSKFQIYIISIVVVTLIAFSIIGGLEVDSQLHNPFVPKGWSSVLSTVGLIIISFAGFEKVSTTAGEIKKPGRYLPLAILASVITATIIYAGILFVSTGIINYERMGELRAPLINASRALLDEKGATVMGVVAIAAMLSASNASIITSSRINYAMGRDRILPGWFGKVHSKNHTPHRAVVVTGVLSIILGISGEAERLAEIASAMFMVSYALLVTGLIIIRKRSPEWYKPAFKTPLYPVLPAIGGIASLAVIFFMDTFSQLSGLGLAILGAAWYNLWGRKNNRIKNDSSDN